MVVEGFSFTMRGGGGGWAGGETLEDVMRWFKRVGEQRGAEQAIGGLAAVDQTRLPLKCLRQAGVQAGGLQTQTLIRTQWTCEQSCFPVCIIKCDTHRYWLFL